MYIAPWTKAIALPCGRLEVAKFCMPQIKRFAQRLFYYVLFPTHLPILGLAGEQCKYTNFFRNGQFFGQERTKKYVNALWDVHVLFAKCIGLCLGVLLDGEFAAVVTAFGAYVVIHYWSTAVAAGGKLCFLQGVVCSALRCASLRESVFWMWHIIIIFLFIFPLTVLVHPNGGRSRHSYSLSLRPPAH